MKKIFMTLGAFLLIISFNACSPDNKEAVKADVNDLSNYVDSVSNLQPVYTETQWAAIDNGYKTKSDKVEKVAASLDETDKTKVDASKKKYSDLKDKYETNIKAANARAKARQDFRDGLLGAGKMTADNQWGFVTPANVVSVYENFVNTVRDKGTNYSDEDWAETKSLWKGLNDRKDEIEKDISGGDKAKIVGIKIAYAGIKSVNRPISDIKEEVKKN